MTQPAHPPAVRERPAASCDRSWRAAARAAAPVVALVAGLMYYWFAVADRYAIFLYFHDMGPGLDTTPFGRITASRYWMAGLVASGAALCLNVTLNLVLGRLRPGYRPPPWTRVWACCAAPLAVLIPAIVMTANDPVLPLVNAAQVTAATLAGLALALAPGDVAARRPLDLALWAADGLGPALWLLALPLFAQYPQWLARGRTVWIAMHWLLLGAGLAAVAALTWLYRRLALNRRSLRSAPPTAGAWLVAAADVAYLLLPLCHHLFFSTDSANPFALGALRYISDSDNYFARSPWVQIVTWAAVAVMVWGVAQSRERRLNRGWG